MERHIDCTCSSLTDLPLKSGDGFLIKNPATGCREVSQGQTIDHEGYTNVVTIHCIAYMSRVALALHTLMNGNHRFRPSATQKAGSNHTVGHGESDCSPKLHSIDDQAE